MVINHLLTGMILQAFLFSDKKNGGPQTSIFSRMFWNMLVVGNGAYV